MSDREKNIQGAKVIVETCMGIKAEERVLIITSKGFSKNANMLAGEIEKIGAVLEIATVKVRDMLVEPPEEVSKKMLESDVVLAVLPYNILQLFPRFFPWTWKYLSPWQYHSIPIALLWPGATGRFCWFLDQSWL